jgi:6-phosphogluconolactonase (cycloisomerase 2 family)
MSWLRKCFKVLTLGIVLNLVLGVTASFADAVTYLESYTNNVNGVTGLQGISDVAVSPDGKFVYTASYQASAVSVFERNPVTGQLTYRSTKTGLSAAFSVDVSADNKNVYVASPTGSVVIALSRDLTTGELTETNRLGGSPTGGFVSVSTSPDAKTVYGVGGSPSGLVVFNRDATTGSITRLADYADNVSGNALGQVFSPTGSPIKNIASSTDGRFVYVTSTTDNAVSLFSRDTTTGALTLVSVYTDNIASVDGLQAASSAKLSPDGKHLYVTGQGESSVAIFSVNSTSGELTYLAKVTHGTGGITNMQGSRSLAISPDGKYVLVSAISSSSLTAYLRDSTTGLLTFDSVIVNTVNGVTNFSAPSGMSTDPLNRHLYVAAQNSSSLVVFSLPTPAVNLSVTSKSTTVSGPAVVLDNQLAVLDSDSPNLVSAQVSVSSGFIATDTLAVQTVAGISVTYDSATGVLSLSGVASLADYQTVLRSLTYQAGADPTLNNGDSSQRTISFVVSDGDNSSAASSIVVTVTAEQPSLFTVNFVDWDNTVLNTQQVGAGSAAVAPTSPARTGYTFTGWSVPFDNISSALTVQAQYSLNSYTLTFDSAGGSVIAPITVNFDAAITAPANPTREGYSFAGWNPALPATMPAANTTVTAQWTVNASYTITFDSAGGSAVAPISANFGAAVTAPAAPTREGYSFAGWTPTVPTTMPAANTTVTAQWTVNAYTITFDSAGGSAVAPISANFGAAVTAPAAPTREGYSFAGWTPTVPGTMPSANTTVTAQWTVNAYTITFNSAGGSAVAPISANFGAAVTAPAAPARDGYTFAGWTPSVPTTMPAANTTVTAQWTVNAYTITFDSAGGSAVAPISANFGAAVTAPAAPTREGYSFAGWTPTVPGTMPSANTTVTAQWTVNAYTITFDSAGGSAVAPISANFGAAVTAPAAPTREGYSFAGWTPTVPTTMPAANTTVTAQWTVNTYTITFNSAGGSAVAPISANFGVAVIAPAAPTREGYSFAGWTPTVPGTMPSANTTVTAQWTVNSYTITFNSAGGSVVEPITASYGVAVTAPADPTREGYSFAGWSPSVPTTMPSANTTVTAQWTVNAYTITFDSAGGSAVAPISANFGAAVTAPAAPARDGYTFAGWTPTVPTTMPSANTTVTAQWTVNDYTITFDSAGGSAVAPISANFGAAVIAPANPTREGFTFVRWDPVVPATMPAQNLALTAQYEQIQLMVTATVTGEASISPATQQVNYGSTATVELSLNNADDIVVLSGTCQTAVSGNQIQTSAIKQACTIAVTVYPFTQVEKDTDAALASNGTSRFSFSSGAGTKTLLGATVMRSGVESKLELADAEALLTMQDDGSYIFSAQRTGRYTLEFVDAVSGERVEVMYNVFPYLAFTSSQQPVQQDVATTVRVWLSDEPVEYPVTSAVTKNGVQSELQQIEFTAEHNLRRSYTVTATATPAQLVLRNAGIVNALQGTPAIHNLAVQQELPALALSTKAMQNGAETYVVDQTAGPVALSVAELNATEASYNWTASGLTLQASGATASFDPGTLAEGRYTITVTGQSANGRTGQYDLALRVIAGCPVESCAGAGNSGIPTEQNNVADTPNRLPLCPNVTEDNRVGSCQAEGAQALYAEVPNQYQLTLGALTEEQSWSTGQFGIALSDGSLNDAGFVQQGVVINFDVLGLENPGEVVPVAIPLPAGTSVPANAVWRKFINGQWQNFVVDSANRVDSAARDVLGQCPGVSSDSWISGLTAGHGCVRLTIQDGGPNDDDGVANSVIRDPGVLAVAEVVVPPTPVPVPPKDVTAKSGGSMGVMLSVLLGGLAAFRLRKLVLAAATVVPLTVSAQDLYLGVDLMSVSSDTSSAEVTDAMNAKGIAGTAVVDDKTRAGFRLYAGHKFTDSVSVELGWLDAGEITTLFSDVAPDTEASDLESVWPTSGEGIELSLLWQPATVAELFTPGIRLGVWQMEVKDRFFDSADVSSQSQSKTVPFAELQGQLKLNAEWSLKMGVSYYDVENADLKTAQFGLIRRF